jgi:carboxylesterase type B
MPHWPAYDAATQATLILNTQPTVIDDPDHAERTALATVMRPPPA